MSLKKSNIIDYLLKIVLVAAAVVFFIFWFKEKDRTESLIHQNELAHQEMQRLQLGKDTLYQKYIKIKEIMSFGNIQ